MRMAAKSAGAGEKPPAIMGLARNAAAGDASAACSLGDHYRQGDIVQQDWNLAFHWYTRAAELGNPEAENNLGSLYLNGNGCDRDPAKAIHFYRKSAEQGVATAQYNLAKRYLHGQRKWFEKAATQGEAWACCELGTMYRLGQGVPRNLLVAAEF